MNKRKIEIRFEILSSRVIIENNSTKTIYSIGETNIYFSLFIKNTDPYFHPHDKNSKIILSMCYIDKDTNLGSVSINKNDKISDSSILSSPFIFLLLSNKK